MEAREKWLHSFKALKEKNCQPRILYPVNIYFRNKDEIETLSDKGKLRVLIARRTALKKLLKEVLKTEGKANLKH